MDRTWKIYGILVVLAGLLFGGPSIPNASSSYEPTVPPASVPSVQSAATSSSRCHATARSTSTSSREGPFTKSQRPTEGNSATWGQRPPWIYRRQGVSESRASASPRPLSRVRCESKSTRPLAGCRTDRHRTRYGKAYYTGNHYRTFTPLNQTP